MHVSDLNKTEAASVPPKNVVASRTEDGSLPDLGPIIQVPKPMALAEVADQVYETVLRKDVCHLLAPWAPCSVDVHVQVPEENGFPEALQGILQVRQMLQHRQRYL